MSCGETGDFKVIRERKVYLNGKTYKYQIRGCRHEHSQEAKLVDRPHPNQYQWGYPWG